MSRQREPLEGPTAERQGIATWEPTTVVDRLACVLYRGLRAGVQAGVLLVALVLTLSLLVSPAVLVAEQPTIALFIALSIVPAAVLAWYIWSIDVTTREPITLLAGTFFLAVLFATFAAIVNSAAVGVLERSALLGGLVFFYLVVGPVEEGVKLLAVRALPYRYRTFDAVIVGTVYGAVAGLGFAAIENALYITQYTLAAAPEAGLVTAVTGITTVRLVVGPGHVLFSAIAGYYLGLAKFTPQYAGPLVVKGLLIASVAHGTYNVTVQFVPDLLAAVTPLGSSLAFVTFVLGFDLIVAAYLYVLVARYRRTYRSVYGGPSNTLPDMAEFDPPSR